MKRYLDSYFFVARLWVLLIITLGSVIGYLVSQPPSVTPVAPYKELRRTIRFKNQTLNQLVIGIDFCDSSSICRVVHHQIKLMSRIRTEFAYPINTRYGLGIVGISWQAGWECYGRVRSDDLIFNSYVFKKSPDGKCYYEAQDID